MYPVLYDDSYIPNLESNGIGVLDDCLSCVVTEERNGLYELEMTYPVKGRFFKELLARRMILATHDKTADAQVFDIYSVSKPTKGQVTVKAHHISRRLKRVILAPFTSIGIGPTTWFTNLEDPNFTEVIGGSPGGLNGWDFSGDVGDTGYTDTTITVAQYSNLYDIMMREGGPILGRTPVSSQNTIYYSGFGENAFDYRFGYYTCEILQSRGSVKDITLRRDKNVRQITESYDDTGALTGVFPYWRGRNNAGDEIFKDLRDSQDPSVVDGIVFAGSYDVDNVEVKDFSSVWEQEPTEAELLQAATDYINIVNSNVVNNLSYVVDLAPDDTSIPAGLFSIQLCDTVTVQDDILGVDKQLKVVSLTFDVLSEQITSIQLGRLRPKISTELKRANDIWIRSSEQTANEETDASAEAKRGVSVTSYVQATRAASVQKIADVNVRERDGTTTTYPINAPSGGGGGYPYWGRPATIIHINEFYKSGLSKLLRVQYVLTLLNSVDTDGHTTNRIIKESETLTKIRLKPFEIPILDPKSNYDEVNTRMVVYGSITHASSLSSAAEIVEGFFDITVKSGQLFYLDTNPNNFYITITINDFIGVDGDYTDLYGGYWSYRGFKYAKWAGGMTTFNSQDGDFTYTVTQGTL